MLYSSNILNFRTVAVQFFKLVPFLSDITLYFCVFCTKTFVCFTNADRFPTNRSRTGYHSSFQGLMQARTLARCPQNKRRTPSWHPSLSILTSSPFASSGSVSLPQLIRKATHRRTSSKIQPFFLIRNLHFAPYPDFKSQIFHLQLFNMRYLPAFSQ